eukprot:Cvel_34616.t1-p1 / transcript=Cvel_34616.t1 / gene=Cvel_34616 / organism=Chromera_velia_CCMP2878 / gene_product=hypothetical protein / transcript_product=hypothetical protein / location=Cvel_scaffold6009:1-1500(-) / protein_length=383 / sequence_SO=supercontig / SO=protein_coding / is_pseudo=false
MSLKETASGGGPSSFSRPSVPSAATVTASAVVTDEQQKIVVGSEAAPSGLFQGSSGFPSSFSSSSPSKLQREEGEENRSGEACDQTHQCSVGPIADDVELAWEEEEEEKEGGGQEEGQKKGENEKKRRGRKPSGIPRRCEHGKERRNCKDCGGTAACMHGRRRYDCRDCGGRGICRLHGKAKRRCRECGGSSLCEHQRERYRCKECGGGRKTSKSTQNKKGLPSDARSSSLSVSGCTDGALQGAVPGGQIGVRGPGDGITPPVSSVLHSIPFPLTAAEHEGRPPEYAEPGGALDWGESGIGLGHWIGERKRQREGGAFGEEPLEGVERGEWQKEGWGGGDGSFEGGGAGLLGIGSPFPDAKTRRFLSPVSAASAAAAAARGGG